MTNWQHQMRRLLPAVAFLYALACHAQISTTRIEDIIYNADGSTVEGTVEISWDSFTAADGSALSKSSITVDIVQGVLAVDLTPNEGATPEGTSYRVDYSLTNGVQHTETWVVPVSAEPLALPVVRVGAPPTPGTILSQSQVSGLVPALESKAELQSSNTFVGRQTIQESTSGEILLELLTVDGSESISFRLPSLTASTDYALPPADGLPNQSLTTDGAGHLFWSTPGVGAGGTAYEVVQNNGVNVTQRNILNFTNGFTAFDEPESTRTTVSPVYGTSAGTITQGNDFRLSNARTPLPHAASHYSGPDKLDPTQLGVLRRTNDTITGSADPTQPVLRVVGGPMQSGSLQEWRDGTGSLAALVTPNGAAFFREMGLSARPGSTVATQFYQIDGINRFGLSATPTIFDVIRYDDAGVVKDRPFRIFRNGDTEINTKLRVKDQAVGPATTMLAGSFFELPEAAAPTTPTTGFTRVFLNQGTGELSVRKPDGSTVSLESGGSGGGGGGSGGSFGQFVDNETPSGAVNGVNPTFTLAFAPDPPESLELVVNGQVQQAGVNFTLSGQTITFLSGSIPTSGSTIRAWYRTGASEAGGDLSGDYPSPEVSGIRGRLVAEGEPLNGECLAWNTLNSQWEPGPCAVVTDQLTWEFKGSVTNGTKPITLTIPEGVTAATLKEVRIVAGTTSASNTTLNIERCVSGCGTSIPSFSTIYASARTLNATMRSQLLGVPNTTAVSAGDQFRVQFLSVGSGLADVTIMLIFEYQAYAALEGQSPLNCNSFCAEIWAEANLDPLPFGPARQVGDACVCFGPELPERDA